VEQRDPDNSRQETGQQETGQQETGQQETGQQETGHPDAAHPGTGQQPTTQPPARAERASDPLRASRTSRSWLSLAALVVVLILLVVFIAQNTQQVEVSFFGWSGHPPLSVALLVAAVGGAALALIVGTLRLWQVRRRVRRAA
jgi:uncharacterized integral membrane protein